LEYLLEANALLKISKISWSRPPIPISAMLKSGLKMLAVEFDEDLITMLLKPTILICV
jgi:hypothetical protein